MSLIRGASILVIASSLLVAGCGTMRGAGDNDRGGVVVTQKTGGFGGLFGRKRAAQSGQAQNGIGVNSYLWRASLDTVSFMPLASADPWGGVIITDWYSNPESPGERFKTTVYILDTRLRADALAVTINKQVRAGDQWVDTAVNAQTETDLENAILTKARQLRLANAGN
jgi:predicted small secreted protein